MPYNLVNQLPAYVKEYSPKIQRMWMSTFNSVWKKLTKEGITRKTREQRCFRAANSVIKCRMEKHGANKYGHGTFFMMSVDSWLGNLNV